MSDDAEGRPVYLDMRHVRGLDLHKRFPGISALLGKYGLDLHRDLVPVRPAAHYLMGGIRTDLDGRTSVRGLYAAGEAACTGVHGANRLASNSLLEGLVFGARAAKAMLEAPATKSAAAIEMPEPVSLGRSKEALVDALVWQLQKAMWKHAGLLRDETLLREGLAALAECESAIERIAQEGRTSRRLCEARSLCRVAEAILQSAMARTESRGAHYRSDYPQHNDAQFRKHSIFGRGAGVVFETW